MNNRNHKEAAAPDAGGFVFPLGCRYARDYLAAVAGRIIALVYHAGLDPADYEDIREAAKVAHMKLPTREGEWVWVNMKCSEGRAYVRATLTPAAEELETIASHTQFDGYVRRAARNLAILCRALMPYAAED